MAAGAFALSDNLQRAVRADVVVVQHTGEECQRQTLTPALYPVAADAAVAVGVLHDRRAARDIQHTAVWADISQHTGDGLVDVLDVQGVALGDHGGGDTGACADLLIGGGIVHDRAPQAVLGLVKSCRRR